MKKLTAAFVSVFIVVAAQAGLTDYQASISAPSDSGAGPALWYQTTGNPNSGSGGASHTLTQDTPMDSLSTDYWGNAGLAYGPSGSSGWVSGTSVANSEGLFASGNNGTVSFMFKTPGTLANAGLFNQGSYNDSNQFELFLLGSGGLRLGTQNGATKQLDTFATGLSANTWYYYGMSWDLSKTSDDLTWFFGEAGGILSTGAITMTSAGDSTKRVFLGGRSTGNKFTGGSFQNMAVYERTLSDAAIQSQFDAIPEPATLGLVSMVGVGLLAARRLRLN